MQVAYFTQYLNEIKSGPGRFSEQLRNFHSDKINFLFFSDSIIDPKPNEVKTLQWPFFKSLPGYWLIRSFLFYRAFCKYSKNFQLVICSNAFEAFFLTLLNNGTPLFIMINDDNYIYTKNNFKTASKVYSTRKLISRYLGYFIEKYVSQKSIKIIACSHFLKEEIIKNYQITESKIEVLYPAVDLEIFKPFQGNRHSLKNEEVIILFAKNDWKRGGLDIIIEALSKYKGPKKILLKAVGVSEFEKPKIITIANNFHFQNNISIEGIQSKNDLLNNLFHADLLVLCSRQEAFGIILLEAMATGTPIIATNVGGIPEVLDNGNAGFLIPPDSPQELSFLIRRLLNDPKLVLPKIEYGLNHCKKFSTNVLYSNLDKFLMGFKKN